MSMKRQVQFVVQWKDAAGDQCESEVLLSGQQAIRMAISCVFGMGTDVRILVSEITKKPRATTRPGNGIKAP